MKVKTSQSFQKQVKKTLFSILLFIIVYLILLLATIYLTVLFTYIGIWAITSYPNILTIGLGLGLIASALTILFFLVKFIFASSKTDTSDLIEISQADQPELFKMIHELVDEIKTEFPNKVYLSHNVNASVFYNSSFWSMFFPVRKNLQIGIGLINSLTNQELKAILAHEFGHFSQKSMKVGSYVYNVNAIIYNMLYNNQSLMTLQNRLSNLSGYMAITLGLSSISINGIQKILNKLYDHINLNYMALSREMEFHADQISAHVAGSNALSDALLRLSFANYSLDQAIYFYEVNTSENLLPQNIYQDQHALSLLFARNNDYGLQYGFPKISVDSGAKYNKSKLIFENQWASHPSTVDRVMAIQKENVNIENPNHSPAINLLNNKETLIQQVQNFLFKELKHEGDIKLLDDTQFVSRFEIDLRKNEFDKMYNDFYMYANPIVEDFKLVDFNANYTDINALFTDENTELSIELNSLINDKQSLENIDQNIMNMKTFDYDGVKYKKSEVDHVLKLVINELNDKKQKINQVNNSIFESFYHMSKSSNKEFELRTAYDRMNVLESEYEEKVDFYLKVNSSYKFIYYQLEYTEIITNFSNNKPLEQRLKEELSKLLKDDQLKNEIHPETLSTIQIFLNSNLEYFYASEYNNENLDTLFISTHQFYSLLNRAYYLQKKLILDLQKEIYLAYKNKSGN